jgi:protein-tyrosine phosphatase
MDWRTGAPADPRAQAEALRHGLDLSSHCARQISIEDFRHFDYIAAMDEDNVYDLEGLRPPEFMGWLGLLLEHAPEVNAIEVPDPYAGGPEHFSRVYALIQTGAQHLLKNITGH